MRTPGSDQIITGLPERCRSTQTRRCAASRCPPRSPGLTFLIAGPTSVHRYSRKRYRQPTQQDQEGARGGPRGGSCREAEGGRASKALASDGTGQSNNPPKLSSYLLKPCFQKNSDLEVARSRKKAAEAKSYDTLDKAQADPDEDEDDEAWERRRQKDGDFDPDEVCTFQLTVGAAANHRDDARRTSWCVKMVELPELH